MSVPFDELVAKLDPAVKQAAELAGRELLRACAEHGLLEPVAADIVAHSALQVAEWLEASNQDEALQRAYGKGLTVNGFMCLTDWQHEIGEASDGQPVYASVKDLMEHRSCWQECGVIEVQVSAVRIVIPGDMWRKDVDAAPDADDSPQAAGTPDVHSEKQETSSGA